MSGYTKEPWIYEMEETFTGGILYDLRDTKNGSLLWYGRSASLERRAEVEANALLAIAAPELLEACRQQHKAIDTLFAMLIDCDKTFLPTRSGKPWEAFLAGNAAIAEAEKGD